MSPRTTGNRAPAAFFSDEVASLQILNNIPEGYTLVNPQLFVVYCNRAARENTRNYQNIDLYPGMSILDLIVPGRHAEVRQLFSDALAGKPQRFECHFTGMEGLPVYIANHLYAAYDADMRITGIVVTSKDISEEKAAQQQICESEERLQFALEAAGQGAWDWNLQTGEVVYSTSYKKLYGFEDNILKNHISEWITRIHPDDQQKMRSQVQEHLQSSSPVYTTQYRIRDKDCNYRWVAAQGTVIRNEATGDAVRMIGIHTDITDVLEREARLQQMNERFNSVLKATHELVWEWDLITQETFRSEHGLLKVYGVADGRSIKKREDWLQRLHPDDRPKALAMERAILQAPHQHTFEMEYRFRRDDGEYAHVYDRGILLRDENDRPIRIIGSVQDISIRKRLEKELLQNELEYQRLLHQATVDSQEHERAEIGKELHDNVNQVLTTTKLYLDLALTNCEIKEELIQKSLNNINTVIQEIRLLSRSLMDPCIGDLGLVDSLEDLIENIHFTQKVQIRLTTEGEFESILSENQKLTLFRIVQEALSNVLRHAHANQVTIKIGAQENWLHMIFEDDGVGFHLDAQKKGAGLKNIQNRIYLINGTLQLQSAPGKGCILNIQFPIEKT